MDPHAPPSLLSSVHRLLADERRRRASDRDLLQAFVQRRESDAFAELLRRHGPMVLRLALHLLHHRQDAEDVFQTAFLTLARKAHSLRNECSVAAWLHRVAWRLALRSRAASKRRSRPLPSPLASEQHSPADEISLREAQEILHQELAALPERLRLPLVLCYLQGRTQDEAARRLGWSLATLKRRLDQGRKLLHARLSRRGVELPAVLAAALLAAAELPASLAASTLGLATSSASVPAAVAVLLAEMSSSLKAKALWGLALMLGACAGAWVYHGQSGEPAETQTPPAAAKSNDPSRVPAKKISKRETISVSGQVLDPDGKPLAGAQVAIVAGIRRFLRHGGVLMEQRMLGQGETDREGRFRLTAPRTSFLRDDKVYVVAAHAGYGLGWQSFDAKAEPPTVAVRLPVEQILRGRLIDLQGRAVAGAKLQMEYIDKEGTWFRPGESQPLWPVWPRPVIADKEGRFQIRGMGRGTDASVRAEQESCAPEMLQLSGGDTKTFVLAPARLLEGRIVYADTGKPAPDVEVGAWGVRGKTDKDGRFRLNPMRGPINEGEEDGLIMAYAPPHEPYMNVQKRFHWPKPALPQAALKHRVDLALPRGVLVSGRITEKNSGKAVAGAYVFYMAQHNNPNFKLIEAGPNNFASGRNAVTSEQDGTFRIACLPGAGYLTIEGPDPDYVLVENGGYDRLYSGKPGGQPWRSHGFAALDLHIGAKPPQLAIALRKGVTLKATVSGPGGQAIGDLQVFCRLAGLGASPVKVQGNRVELHGCDAEEGVRVMVVDAKHQWGATVEMSARNAGEKPMPIRLAPCGSARVRFVDAEGKPLAKFYPGLFLEVAPKQGNLRADTVPVYNPYDKSGPHTDEQGCCTLTALIPGATYRFGFVDLDTNFVAKVGEVLKLPDVVMKRN